MKSFAFDDFNLHRLNMSTDGPSVLLLRNRINSFKSAGIDKIWMTVSGSGDFTMANVLGFLDEDLILLLKTTGLITSKNKINKMETWSTRIGIPIEWNCYAQANWCRFKFETTDKSTPANNNVKLLNQFNTAKANNGCGGARRGAFDAAVTAEINQYLAQQPVPSSLSSVSIIPAALSASERSIVEKQAADAAKVIEQLPMRQLKNEMSLLELFNERDADEREEDRQS